MIGGPWCPGGAWAACDTTWAPSWSVQVGCTAGGSVSGVDGGGGRTDSQLVGGEKNRKLAKSAGG